MSAPRRPETPISEQDDLDAYAEKIVAGAPPLTESQKDRIRLIFQPVTEQHREAS